jgi:hypothetical protein
MISASKAQSIVSRKSLCFFGLGVLISLQACSQDAEPPELSAAPQTIISNAQIYTFAWDEPNGEGIPAESAPEGEGRWQADAQALAITDGVISANGQ